MEQQTQNGVTMTRTALSSLMDTIVRRCQENDPNLVTLELFGLPVTTDEVYAICTALGSTNTYVEVLDWGKHEVASHAVAPAVAQALLTNRTLKVLYLTECNIGTDGLRALCYTLKNTNCSVQELYLRDNHIDDNGAFVIADMIRWNTSLLKLDMAFNDISSRGAVEIANAIQQSSNTLRDFNIGYNQIGNDGITAFAKALKCNTSQLFVLDLRDNKIIMESSMTENTRSSNSSIVALAEAIRVNKKLKVLDLGYNNLQTNDTGVVALANALRYNTTLETLGLCCCNISVLGSKALIDAIGDYNETLLSINLSIVPRFERMQLNRIVAGNRLYNRKAPKKDSLQRQLIYFGLNNYWIQPIV